MQELRCLIVDDEPLATDLLQRYIAKTPFLTCVQSCNSAISALEILRNREIELLFLDIQMPDLSGLELSRMIDKKTRVIFTTAFSDYAVEGFKVNALDYLLKPFDYEEFLRAALKAREQFTGQKSNGQIQEPGNEFIFVKSEYKQVKIALSDVLYFEGMKDYVKIWLRNQNKPVMTILSLKSLEEKLDKNKFMRVHRSFILGLDQIEAVERGQVIMPNGVHIGIAEKHKEAFIAFISGKSLNT